MPLIVNGTKIKHLKVIQNGVTKEMKVGKFSDGTIFFKGKPTIEVRLYDHSHSVPFGLESSARAEYNVLDWGVYNEFKIITHYPSTDSTIVMNRSNNKNYSQTGSRYVATCVTEFDIYDNEDNSLIYNIKTGRLPGDVPSSKNLILWKTITLE